MTRLLDGDQVVVDQVVGDQVVDDQVAVDQVVVDQVVVVFCTKDSCRLKLGFNVLSFEHIIPLFSWASKF